MRDDVRIVQDWVEEHIHNSPISRSTETWNMFREHLLALKTELERGEESTEEVLEKWVASVRVSGFANRSEALEHFNEVLPKLEESLQG